MLPEDGVGDLRVGEGQVLLAYPREDTVVYLPVEYLSIEIALDEEGDTWKRCDRLASMSLFLRDCVICLQYSQS